MPTAITGDSASFNTGATVALTGPADGEGIDAADLNVPLETLADGVEHYRTYGNRLNAAQTITAAKTHDLADENSAALLSVEPATRVFWMTLPLTGTTGAANIYHAEGLELAQNATWANGTALWTQTDVGLDSWMIRFNAASGVIQFLRKAAGAGPTWADGAWTVAGYVGAGGLTGIGVTSSSGDITSANDIGANRDITASRHLVATENITATTGNIAASAGKVQAQGDPASDEARVECKQFVSTAAGSPTASKGAALNNGDVDGTATVVAGSTDIKGRLTLITGAAVNAASGQNITVVTFNKAYPTAPEVIIYPTNVTTANLATQPFVSTSTTTFTITIGATALTSGTVTYGWAYHVIG